MKTAEQGFIPAPLVLIVAKETPGLAGGFQI
jgi:hypothetical protein